MMARIAAALLIASQLLLVWAVLAPSGRSSIYFMFVGHPLVAIGFVLAFVALARRLARERAARQAAEPSSPRSAAAG